MKIRVRDKQKQTFIIGCSEKTDLQENEFIARLATKGIDVVYHCEDEEMIYSCDNTTDSFFAAELANELGLVWRKL